MNWDVFISHASEDKKDVARPLAIKLRGAGLRVWLDENEFTLGDSLRAKIDQGLAESRFGIVILSPSFFAKDWPLRELNGLAAQESLRRKILLPVWHQIDHDYICRYSPMLADRLAIRSELGMEKVAAAVMHAMTVARDSDEWRAGVGILSARHGARQGWRRGAGGNGTTSAEVRRLPDGLDRVVFRA